MPATLAGRLRQESRLERHQRRDRSSDGGFGMRRRTLGDCNVFSAFSYLKADWPNQMGHIMMRKTWIVLGAVALSVKLNRHLTPSAAPFGGFSFVRLGLRRRPEEQATSA